jgi:integrase
MRGYAEAQALRKLPQAGLFFSLIAEYKASADYQQLASSTKKSYLSYFKLIEVEFGNMPIAALSDQRIRSDFKTWRDAMVSTPRKADLAWSVLARVLSFAKDRGRISNNPCERGGRLYTAHRTEKVWSENDIQRLLKFGSVEMRLATLFALCTAQRQGDLLRLRWSDYDGETIRLVQSKTGRPVSIRVVEPLKTELKTAPRRGPFIITNTKGLPWTSDGFRTSWAKLCGRANIDGLTFHDLRGTAITRLAHAGATPQEIASVSGHSIADVSAMLDRHYLGDRAGLAESAMRRVEKKNRTKTVKRL